MRILQVIRHGEVFGLKTRVAWVWFCEFSCLVAQGDRNKDRIVWDIVLIVCANGIQLTWICFRVMYSWGGMPWRVGGSVVECYCSCVLVIVLKLDRLLQFCWASGLFSYVWNPWLCTHISQEGFFFPGPRGCFFVCFLFINQCYAHPARPLCAVGVSLQDSSIYIYI